MTRDSDDVTWLVILSFCILVALKWAGAIDWSWWIITSPLWGGFLLHLLCLTVWLIVTQFRE